MSSGGLIQNVVIETDGVSHSYGGVKKIRTADAERNHTYWVPLKGTKVKTKEIYKNGTYKAVDEQFYGYDKVIVSVGAEGVTVGLKENGRTYAVTTTEDGFFRESLLPDNIRIITEPTKKTYEAGEQIDLTGAVVKAYSLNDVWEASGYSGGRIPVAELIAKPSEAIEGVTTISITWNRPDDNAELSDDYTITIGGA